MKNIYTLLLASIIVTSIQAQTVDLSLKLEKGKEYKQVTSQKTSALMNVEGQKSDAIISVNGAMTYRVTSINENGYNMDAKFDELSMSRQMPQNTQEFSSETNDTDDEISGILSAMKGKSFEVLMTKNGEITQIKNSDALWQTAMEKFEPQSEMDREQIEIEQLKTHLLKAYGDEGLKSKINLVMSFYPDRPVKKGDKWTTNTNNEIGFAAKICSEYQLADLTSDYALIKGKATIEPVDKDKFNDSSGVPMKYNLTGSMISEIKVDIKTGWIIEAKVNNELNGNVYIEHDLPVPIRSSQESYKNKIEMEIEMTMTNEILVTN